MTPTPTTDSAVSPVSDAELLHRQLRQLAVSMARQFYPEVPEFRPLDDALGLLSQIDNMTTGLSRRSLDTADGVEGNQPETQAGGAFAGETRAEGNQLLDLIRDVANNPPDLWGGVVGDPGRVRYDTGWFAACHAIRARILASRTPNTEMVVKAEPVAWETEPSGLEVVTIEHDEFSLIEISKGYSRKNCFHLTIHSLSEESGRRDDLSIELTASEADKVASALASPPSPAEVTITDDMVENVKALEAACNQARLALAGMVSIQSALDLLDCRPLGISAALQLNKKG